ncbi:nitric oxide synthase, inducible [Lagopus leucura]|uniref:nitric oxide synthase, inducible n=1 Tax=Lagopus leucura TaxID=30410 RepID=UPI001C677503|nr:nitric oxide synthase, inducible [Lagopus leucura]XP_042735533.1 nitric oxide synthase, inducible [Lagopus leucura]XP_042735534.1 nitric oxide synthase, inducible [Lagopus leucura]
MLCPWQFVFKPRVVKNQSSEEKDINNNVEKDTKFHGFVKDDAKLHSISKKQIEMSPISTSAEKPPQNGIKASNQISTCPRHVKVRNLENGSSLLDTLHLTAKEVINCRTKACQGALMTPKSLVRGTRDGPVPPAELLPQAIDFVKQYYSSFKELKIEEHLARLETVTKEIETTGTYHLTKDELIFAAKQAWRNAPRCIGRIQWSNLQVFDARDCKTAKEMFECICRHIQFATNNGNIRSAITIFPQRTDGKHDFRVWNSQFIRYAGYQMPDGSVIGDPASVEFTKLCIELGWKPKYGRFDIVPLVLQANGQDPEIFEYPPEIILEVPMEHPKYEWFKELDLKWYALPAVANMLLEVGGLEFTACPFNGWYMGTEIGVRDFCDVQRYNILKEVGRRMGLETNKLASLWKDRAVVEINVAVLHSFQQQNVTIMDHHSAAESFMKYMQNEYRVRGGCPADWVWIVPPMSGSITPVFHQEMLNYVLTPFFYYQVDAWKTHIWHDETRRPKRREIKLSILAKAVLFASLLLRKTMAARSKVTVIYATETGKSETLASNLCSLFSCAFNTKILCMDEYNISDLEKETLLLVVTSTFGNGDSPNNGKALKNSLLTMKLLRKKIRYAVFGLGSTMYPEFCAFAHAIDHKLSQLGALQLTPVGEGDELNGQEEAFRTWAVTAFKTACDIFDIRGKTSIQLPEIYTSDDSWNPKKYRIVHDSQTMDLTKALADIHGKDIIPMKLKFRQNLQSFKSSRVTILVKLSCESNQEVHYLPGEHIGIFPGNQPELVHSLIARVKDAPPADQTIRLETCTEGGYWASQKKIPACTLSQALTYLLDITTSPSQQLLKKLSQLVRTEGDKQRLEVLCHSTEEYNKWKFYNSPNILEVLEEFPSAEVSTAFLLTQLPLLKPRYYSVSSSCDMIPREIHLTVAVVNYRTRDGQGPLHHGVCSTWLNKIALNETVPCFVRSADGFQLPKEPAKPCILIGPGTGIAPFRSFWQQRLYDLEKKGIKAGDMILLFGCRQPDMDHIYKEEVEEMKRKGVLKEVFTAYSRQPGQPKVYVQDILQNELETEVCNILHKEEGHLYVCGDVRMARDVAQTLKRMLVKNLDHTEKQAEEYFFQLKSQKRYHEDIFGAVLPHEVKRT